MRYSDFRYSSGLCLLAIFSLIVLGILACSQPQVEQSKPVEEKKTQTTTQSAQPKTEVTKPADKPAQVKKEKGVVLNEKILNVPNTGSTFTHEFDGKPHVLNLELLGQPALDIWPDMSVMLDDKEIHKATIKNDTWKEYKIPVKPSAGSHTITITITNDYCDKDKGIDRNLLLQKFSITPEN